VAAGLYTERLFAGGGFEAGPASAGIEYPGLAVIPEIIFKNIPYHALAGIL
jgi:hypothetical protein